MYILNKNEKHLEKIEETTFAEQHLKERYDIQEWIDKQPEILSNILGEDEKLLIIQKEFYNFDKTNERLDLLAIDRKGNLVIIENKRDNSGKDVALQAIKYASYCSTFSKQNIIDIYQSYLNSKNETKRAEELITNFFDEKEFDEIDLNVGYSQRIILVSKEFSSEVTSTVLWLRGNGIDIQCVKITPYEFKNEIIIDIDKIIPISETEKYLVSLSDKGKEEKKSKEIRASNENINSEYWRSFLEFCRDEKYSLVSNRSGSKDHWISVNAGLSGITYALVILKNELRAELYLAKDKSYNKKVYDFLYNYKNEIDDKFGDKLNWDRLDNKNACRISFSRKFDKDDRDKWNEAIHWHYDMVKKLENTFKDYLEKVKKQID
ncbi:DUF4268 domain-containing protein [Lonepinella sp. BR2357]|uniref:DUF4268 domain-containing protein n=1 Tax=Lonepinella sp. BR2357 TaxID=3434549 RepID=UPI003F6DABFE